MEQRGLPIYYVVAEQDRDMQLSMYGVSSILQVYQCDMQDIDTLHTQVVAPLYQQGRNVRTFIFRREPANPFRGWNEPTPEPGPLHEDKPGQLPGD